LGRCHGEWIGYLAGFLRLFSFPNPDAVFPLAGVTGYLVAPNIGRLP
jgi:hypothetical protein